MNTETLLGAFTRNLLSGSRHQCLEILREAQSEGCAPEILYHEVVWKAAERVACLLREDHVDTLREHLATRMLRMVASQLRMSLPRHDPNGKSIIIICAEGEREELGAQVCADLFEANGWQVWLLGGGVPNDEIVTAVGQWRPDMLLIFGTQPQEVAGVRQLIVAIRETAAHPSMNIMVSGGVFNRAFELWKEARADMYTSSPADALKHATAAKPNKLPATSATTTLASRKRRYRLSRSQERVGEAFPLTTTMLPSFVSIGA